MHRLHALTNLLQPSPTHAVELAGLLVAVVLGLWLLLGLEVYELVSFAVAAEIFSGNWKFVPMPLPVDRVLFTLAVVLLALRGGGALSARRLVIQPIHFLLLAVIAWAACSALWFGTLFSSYGFYALLDRLGILPFLMFTLAPLLFATARQRRVLLTCMVAVGLYLDVVGIAEGIGLHALVLPHFISDPSIGITQSRARGPFLASDAMGLGTFDCAVFAIIAFREWRSRKARACCVAVVAMAPLVLLFTLTRAVWIGAVLAAVAVGLCIPSVRRRLPLIAVVAVAVTAVTIVSVPGLRAKVNGRTNTVASVWDRYNTNDAALRAVAEHPLSGVGWERFSTVSWQYLRTPATYPMTGDDLEVHNVFLSHVAELGLPGAALWLLALVAGVGGALWRRGPPELRAWRLGLLGITVMFVVVANLGPLSYAFPNLVLWLTAGIVARDRNSVERWPGDAGAVALLEDEAVLV